MELINGPKNLGPTRPLDFIRHAPTSLNAHGKSEDKIRGWIDVPLDDHGREEAKKAGQKLCSGVRPDILVSSDLSRAAETAHIISQICKIPVGGIIKGLRPWNLGQFQGQESAAAHPQLAHYFDNPTTPVPGGESFGDLQRRLFYTLQNLLRGLPQHRIAVISHHRNERLLAASEKADWRGIDRQEFFKIGDPPGAMIVFNIPVGR